MQIVDDFLSKINLLSVLKTLESIDANYMQMIKCKNQANESYRIIANVLKQFLKERSLNVNLSIKLITQTQQEKTLNARQKVNTR